MLATKQVHFWSWWDVQKPLVHTFQTDIFLKEFKVLLQALYCDIFI